MSDVESYEVQGTPYDQLDDVVSMVNQIATDMIAKNPGYGFRVKFSGNEAIVTYHCWEIGLPTRIKEVESTANTLFDSYVKELKKIYKKETGKNLKFKELKERRSSSAEKVSLNDRYYFRSTRVFEM